MFVRAFKRLVDGGKCTAVRPQELLCSQEATGIPCVLATASVHSTTTNINDLKSNQRWKVVLCTDCCYYSF